MSLFPSLFFVTDIQHAFDLSEVLRGNGIKVYPVSGKTPTTEENRLYRLFQDGAIDGLASCGVLSEGFDSPNAMGAFMCRDTKSGLLFRQCVGRVTRPFPAPTGERRYQREGLQAILEALREGINLQLVAWPTGTGKTMLAAHVRGVIEKWKGRKCRRQMFIVHRDNLVQQAAESFRRWCPDLTVGIEAGGGRYAGDADVVIGSVPALGSASILSGSEEADGDVWEYGNRLSKFNPEHFDAVIADEFHHSAKGKQYHNIFRYFGLLKGEPDLTRDRLLLGITATPNRADNIGLERVCDKITHYYSLTDAIRDGYCSDIRAYRIETSIDISNIKTTAGDFNLAQLEAAINTRERNELVAREYLRIRDLITPDLKSNIGHKPFCVVVDFVDITGHHRLVTTPTLFGLKDQFDLQGGSALATSEEITEAYESNPGLDLSTEETIEAVREKLARIKTSARDLDLIGSHGVPDEIQGFTKFSWVKDGPDSYCIGLSTKELISVRQNAIGQYEIYLSRRGIRKQVWASKTLREAIREAERNIPDSEKVILNRSAGWRSNPPTEAQARRIMVIHAPFNKQFRGSAKAFFEHAMNRYMAGDSRFSRGGLTEEMNRIDLSRK